MYNSGTGGEHEAGNSKRWPLVSVFHSSPVPRASQLALQVGRKCHPPTEPSHSAHPPFLGIPFSFRFLRLYGKRVNSSKLRSLQVDSPNGRPTKYPGRDPGPEQFCHEHFSSRYWPPSLPTVSCPVYSTLHSLIGALFLKNKPKTQVLFS